MLSKSNKLLCHIYRFEALAQINKYYFIKQTRDFCLIADTLEGIESMSLKHQYIFSQAPLKIPINQAKAE